MNKAELEDVARQSVQHKRSEIPPGHPEFPAFSLHGSNYDCSKSSKAGNTYIEHLNNTQTLKRHTRPMALPFPRTDQATTALHFQFKLREPPSRALLNPTNV